MQRQVRSASDHRKEGEGFIDATRYAGKVDKTFPSRFQFLKTRIGRRPAGYSDVSCVPYGPWDKSSGWRYLLWCGLFRSDVSCVPYGPWDKSSGLGLIEREYAEFKS